MKRKILSIILSLSMVLSMLPVTAWAEEPDNLCPHHPEHTEECGYVLASEGAHCAHVHTEDCWTEVVDCVHVHDESCYSDAEDVEPAGPEESEEDGNPADSPEIENPDAEENEDPADGAETRDGEERVFSLAFEAAVPEADACIHVCTEESGCVTQILDCPHEHDEACGYAKPVAGVLCGYVCKICAGLSDGTAEADLSPEMPLAAGFDGGDGTAERPYEISTAEQLQEFAAQVNAGQTTLCATLMTNIDLGGADWTPIGNYNIAFNGTFDGGGHKIEGLNVPSTGYNSSADQRIYQYRSMFGRVGDGGTVQNIRVDGSVVGGYGSYYVGGVVGYNSGSVANCYSTVSIRVGGNNSRYIGGVVGYNIGGSVTNCYNAGVVDAHLSDYVGGVVGYNSGSVTNCNNTGAVTGGYSYGDVGGVVGYNSGSVASSYNTGAVTGSSSSSSNAGGVVGYNSGGRVADCYNTGAVSGQTYIGGVVGTNYIRYDYWEETYYSGTVENCYNVGIVTLLAASNGADGGGVLGPNSGSTTENSDSSAVKSCYYLVGMGSSLDIEGVASISSGAFGDNNTFVGWDFDGGAWEMGMFEGDAVRPILKAIPETITKKLPTDALTKGGDGQSPETAYEIPDLETLENFRYYVKTHNGGSGEYFKLTGNIDLGGEANPWEPIGDEVFPFTGTFDGCGYEITGLYINSSTYSNMGLFGKVDSGGTVKNAGVDGIVTRGGSSYISNYIGGVVGYNDGGSVVGCYYTGVVTGSSSSNVGGVVGYNNGGSVANCYNTGSVASVRYGGGVVGYNNGGSVESCYNAGAVSPNGDAFDAYLGGVVGYNDGGGRVADCYNTGAVSGEMNVGGVVGNNYSGTVENCYNIGDVTGRGVVGSSFSSGGTVTSCYNLEGMGSAEDNVETIPGADFGRKDIFTSAGWDFENGAWEMGTFEGDAVRPILKAVPETITKKLPVDTLTKGNGTEESPYEIPDLETLENFRYYIKTHNGGSGEYFKLTGNIDLGGKTNPWVPIGTIRTPFAGTFDGCGYEITGLYINAAGSYMGLFGYVGKYAYSAGEGGTVQNVRVSGSVTGGRNVGGVVAYSYMSTVTNCHFTGTVSGNNGYVGGVVGYSGNGGGVTNCSNTGTVTGGYNVGGVVGYNYNGSVASCYNTGAVSGTNYYVGGVVGSNNSYNSSSSVASCYNTGAVSGNESVGGVVGENYSSYNYSSVANCYNTGAVTGNSNVGGVAGHNRNSTVTNCYSIGSVTGRGVVGFNEGGSVASCYYLQDTAAGGVGGADSDSAQVISGNAFGEQGTFTGWDFDGGTWEMGTLKGNVVRRPILRAVPESSFAVGGGTEAIPYEIPDLEMLEYFRDYVNAGSGAGEYFRLTADIDMSDNYGEGKASWMPVGNESTPFTGTFDGGGHKITGLYINNSDSDYQGLFGYVGRGGTVSDLGVEGQVTGGKYVGGVVGDNFYGTVENCYNTGAVSGSSNVGGVVGENLGTVENCYSTGSVSGESTVGGVVGENLNTVENCYNTGNVTSAQTGGNIGGVVGMSGSGSTVENCFYLKTGAIFTNTHGTAICACEFANEGTFTNWSIGTDGIWMMGGGIRPILKDNQESGETLTALDCHCDPCDDETCKTNHCPDYFYTVTLSQAQNGSITAEPLSAVAGTIIKLTVDPAEDYRLKSLTVDNASLNETVSPETSEYTFTMPAADVTVTAEFEHIPPAVEINYVAEKLTGTDTTMQYRVGESGNWTTCTEDMTLKSIGWDGTAITVHFRYAVVGNSSDGAVQTLEIPARPAAPAETIRVTKSTSSIVLSNADSFWGCKYALAVGSGASLETLDWNEDGKFINLTPGKEYTLYVRFPAVNGLDSVSYALARAADNKGHFASIAAYKVTVTVNDDGSTTLKSGETVETGNGAAITNNGDDITLNDDSGNTTTVIPPKGKDFSDGVIVDGDSNVTVPEDSTVQIGDSLEMTLPEGGTVDSEGNVTAEEVVMGGITVKGSDERNVTADKDGITVPEGGTVQAENGPEMTLTDGGVLNEDGGVTVPEGGSVQIGDITVTVSEGGGTITPNKDGSIEIPAGSAITKDGTTKIVPESGGKLDKDGHYTDNITTPAPAPTPGGSVSTYTTTVSQTEHGKVTVSPTSAYSGQTVTITVTPDEGYELSELTVTDSLGNKLTLTDKGDGTYTFTMPSRTVTVTAAFALIIPEVCDGGPDCPSYPFADLDIREWYHEYVDYVISNGLMNGYGDGIFGPDDDLSRAMLAEILFRLEGSVPVNYLMQYDDVPAEEWYTEAVRWAASEGIVNGYGDGLYGPDDPITREQLAAILYRYEQSKDGGFTGNWMFRLDFTDAADISDWAYEAMCWCSMNDIVEGKGDGILDPKGKATRAEVAAMLMRFLSRLMGK